MSVAAVAPIRLDQPVAVRLQQAIAHYRDGDMVTADALFTGILKDDPGNEHALHILGLICHKRNDLEMAERLLERAVRIAPHSRAQHNLGVVQQQQGRLDAAIATYRAALALEPDYLEAAMNLLFALDLHPNATPELLLAERRAFAEAFCDPITRMMPPHENDRDPDRRLRVGYVSPDFRDHSAAQSFRATIEAHDPAAVELYLYSTTQKHDATTLAFRERADAWCEVGHLNDREIAQIIREDQIDILVDLAGYSMGGRPLVFAQKPAPIQVTGWGYATGTGMAAMDYLLSDDVAVPSDREGQYRERIMRLPCLLPYTPGAYPDLSQEPPEQRNGYRTYGYLGRAMKVNEPTLALWAAIMRADPTSRLLLKSGQWEVRAMRDRVAQGLWALGVHPSRVEVRSATSRADHLLAHNEIDVALDPTPHGGGMTAADACLMGVPTVTLLGESIPGRTAASILTTIGYRGLVAETGHDYVGFALLGPLRGGRPALRTALLDSVLCQPERYARAVESQYRTAWQQWCREAA